MNYLNDTEIIYLKSNMKMADYGNLLKYAIIL